jgi:hypothetical protein
MPALAEDVHLGGDASAAQSLEENQRVRHRHVGIVICMEKESLRRVSRHMLLVGVGGDGLRVCEFLPVAVTAAI